MACATIYCTKETILNSMTILKVLQYPDLRLRREGYKVNDPTDPKTKQIITDMIETLFSQDSCAGLAATQLDFENPPSITVINLKNSSKKDDIMCLINPEIIESEGSDTAEEACMSIAPRRISAKVKRATKIKVKALDPKGNKIEFEATDYAARCIQHECDHLHGILYIDHISKLKRAYLDKKIAKFAKEDGY